MRSSELCFDDTIAIYELRTKCGVGLSSTRFLQVRFAHDAPGGPTNDLASRANVSAHHFRPLRLVFVAMALAARFTLPVRACVGQPAARRSAAALPRLALPLRAVPLARVKQPRVFRAATRSAARVGLCCMVSADAGALPKGASTSMELDVASLVRYVAATALQLGVIVLVMAGLDAVVLPRLSPVAQRWFVGVWFLFNVRALPCSCRRLLVLTHALSNSLPTVAAFTHLFAARRETPVARV